MTDENIDTRIIKELRSNHYNVVSIQEQFSGMPDEEILYVCKNNDAILITEDKDFGEWVFSYGFKGVSVILLRYLPKDLENIIFSLINFLRHHSSKFSEKFAVITIKKIRIRNI